MILLLVIATHCRNQLYHSLDGIWGDVLSHDPGNHRALWIFMSISDRNGQTDSAVALAEQVLARRPKALVFNAMAESRIEAVVLRRNLAIEAAARLGEGHGEARSAATKLAMALATQAMSQNNPAEAVRLYRLILDAYTTSLGQEHPDTVAVRAKLDAAIARQP